MRKRMKENGKEWKRMKKNGKKPEKNGGRWMKTEGKTKNEL